MSLSVIKNSASVRSSKIILANRISQFIPRSAKCKHDNHPAYPINISQKIHIHYMSHGKLQVFLSDKEKNHRLPNHLVYSDLEEIFKDFTFSKNDTNDIIKQYNAVKSVHQEGGLPV